MFATRGVAVLGKLEETVATVVPATADLEVRLAVASARLSASQTVAWLRPALFPEDDDV